MAAEQTVELKWLIFGQTQHMIPNSTNNSTRHVCNFLWLGCQRVVFGVDVLDLDLWVQIDSIE